MNDIEQRPKDYKPSTMISALLPPSPPPYAADWSTPQPMPSSPAADLEAQNTCSCRRSKSCSVDCGSTTILSIIVVASILTILWIVREIYKVDPQAGAAILVIIALCLIFSLVSGVSDFTW
jgi:hypothetical protein